MIKTVLFDLDGTLLPMDMERFTKDYFSRMAGHMAPHGYDPKKLVDSIWEGTAAMVKNDGSVTNEVAFWNSFRRQFGDRVDGDFPLFESFYVTEFPKIRPSCGYDPAAAEVIRVLKEKGIACVLATNPIFPQAATLHRISWAGLDPKDFLLYTTYENSCHCKPNPAYYEDVLAAIGADPRECLMVGNDVQEDMVARELGMEVFLLTDCLLDRKGTDLSQYPRGGFQELLELVKSL